MKLVSATADAVEQHIVPVYTQVARPQLDSRKLCSLSYAQTPS